jgi:hypothetical protein
MGVQGGGAPGGAGKGKYRSVGKTGVDKSSEGVGRGGWGSVSQAGLMCQPRVLSAHHLYVTLRMFVFPGLND